MSVRIVLIPLAALACAFGAGCVSEGPAPREEMSRARTLVDQADKANAQRYAAADVQRAHDELSAAERDFGAQRYDEAKANAESASADADLATARASAGEARRAAGEVARGNQTLQQETERQPDARSATPAPQ